MVLGFLSSHYRLSNSEREFSVLVSITPSTITQNEKKNLHRRVSQAMIRPNSVEGRGQITSLLICANHPRTENTSSP